MGMMTVFFGMPVNGAAAVNLSGPVNRGYPDEYTRIQQLLNLNTPPVGRLVTSGVSYWQQYSIRIAIRRIAFRDLIRSASAQPSLTRHSVQRLDVLHSMLLMAPALPRLFSARLDPSSVRSLRKQITTLPAKMMWLAVVKGIRAGPTSV